MNNVCAIIPAYNSEKTLGKLIEKVLKFVNDVVVVDDGSVDKTFEIAREFGVYVIRHERNFGKGRALKTGFEFAKSKNYDAVLTLDSDLQHNPEEIPKFFEKYTEGFDIVIGNRMKNLRGMPIERIFSNKTTSFLISLRTGVMVPDSQCGFRMIGIDVVKKVDARSDGFAFESEFLIKALLYGFRVGFVDIETIYNGERSYIKHVRDTFKFVSIYVQSFFW